MILHALRHSGTVAFPREIAIDFTALPPLIAVTGANGAGKSTLLDVLMAPFLGEFAYRPGALSRQFVTKGRIELTWALDGRGYQSVLTVDPDLERTEASLRTAEGTLLAGPLIRDYRKRMAALVGPPEWLLASAYAVQHGVGAFLTLPRPARKALLAELLGLQRFSRLEEAAKAETCQAEQALATTRARLQELAARRVAGATLTREHGAAQATLAAAQAALVEADAAVQEAQEARTSAAAAVAALEPLRAEQGTARAAHQALEARQADLARRQTANRELLGRRAEIDAAGARAEALRAAIRAAETTIESTQARVTQRTAVQQQAALVARDLATAERAVEDLARRARLAETVPCHAEGAYAACGFLADVRTAQTAAPEAMARVGTLRAALTQAQAGLATGSDDPAAALHAAQAARRAAQAALDGLAPVLALVPRLEAATVRLDELEAQATALTEDAARTAARLAELARRLADAEGREAARRAAQRRLNDAETRRAHAQQDVTRWTQAVGRLEGQLAAVAQAEADGAALAATAPALETDVADWAWLTKAFGSTGLPALLIDQALPALGALATTLLREAWGEQVYTITLHTQREAAAGDRVLETLDVRIARGGEALDAALLSGGERVLVSEALSLALALFAGDRGGVRLGVLLRDEVGAALDAERAPAYAAMLRRAAALGGFRHVAFVSHHARAIEGADAVLEVQDGTVTVR